MTKNLIQIYAQDKLIVKLTMTCQWYPKPTKINTLNKTRMSHP